MNAQMKDYSSIGVDDGFVGTKNGKLIFSMNGIPPFKGFKYTVEEGLKLAEQCRTEFPDFLDIASEKEPQESDL